MIEALDSDNQVESVATGFFHIRSGIPYLVTCWHVVTGLDYLHISVLAPPTRKSLRLRMKSVVRREGGSTTTIGSNALKLVDLYDADDKPLWIQQEQHKPHSDLNSIGLYVPRDVDIVALRLNLTEDEKFFLCTDDEDLIDRTREGECLLIAGYPHGYSALGEITPQPIFVSRAVAAFVTPNPVMMLVDGVGARGMSGSPVFIKGQNRFYLIGVYTGAVHTDAALSGPAQRYDVFSSLGMVSRLSMSFAFFQWP